MTQKQRGPSIAVWICFQLWVGWHCLEENNPVVEKTHFCLDLICLQQLVLVSSAFSVTMLFALHAYSKPFQIVNVDKVGALCGLCASRCLSATKSCQETIYYQTTLNVPKSWIMIHESLSSLVARRLFRLFAIFSLVTAAELMIRIILGWFTFCLKVPQCIVRVQNSFRYCIL